MEIEVYSTVGTSGVNCQHSAECRCERAARVRWRSAATLGKRAENDVKDVVKMVVFPLEKFAIARVPKDMV